MSEEEKLETTVSEKPVKIPENIKSEENLEPIMPDEQIPLPDADASEIKNDMTESEEPGKLPEEENETTVNDKPAELIEDNISEKYSEFITENQDPRPHGDFFVDVPIIKRTDERMFEEELIDLPIDEEEQTEITEMQLEPEEQVQEDDSTIDKKSSDDKGVCKKGKSIVFSIYSPRATERAIDRIFRKSIYYDTFARIPTGSIKKISGDFSVSSYMINKNMWFNLLECTEFEHESEEEEENVPVEVPQIKEETVEEFSRVIYYEKHAKLKQEILVRTIESSILQRKIAIYYRRRNMDYAWKESARPYDNKYKYHQRLDEYEQVIKNNTFKRNTIDKQIENLRDAIDRRSKLLEELFNDLQKKEKEIGSGLIYTKTGTEISEKLVLQYISRQRVIMEKLCSMRLKFLKLKRMVVEKENSILSINNVDEDHHLNDYEKLKDDNRIHCDKLEEKEVELTALRFRCNNTIQTIAHLKEKVDAFTSDILDLKDALKAANFNVEDIRARLIRTRKERDAYRTMYIKLQVQSGLLTEKVLLKDMEHCMQEYDALKMELIDLKSEFSANTMKTRRIRKLIEEHIEASAKKIVQIDDKRKITVRRKYNKEKPTSFKPVLPRKVMDHYFFEHFQPTVTRININKKN